MRRILHLSFVLILSFALAACDSAEDRAEAHYQKALELMEAGDPDRAIVELRNALQNVPTLTKARHALAQIYLDETNSPQQAFAEYLRIVEQEPNDTEARIILAEQAFFLANWEEMSRHGEAARTLAADDPRVVALGAALDYRNAVEQDDDAARLQALTVAREAFDPSNPNRILREILMDDDIRSQKFSDALAKLDELIDAHPNELRYHRQRLQLLIALGDSDEIETQLLDMIDRFPEMEEHHQTLIRFYLSRDELDKAEDFLRRLVAEAGDDDVAARGNLIRFLSELRGTEAARAEIEIAIAESSDPTPFKILGAGLNFASGQQEEAIATLEATLEEAGPEDDTSDVQVALASMLLANGNEVGARALVETVLEKHPTNSNALRMNADWLISSDRVDEAIAALRTALDNDPEDVAALNLMADAYTRSGRPNLSRDFLSLAVEASGNAPAETVRYAQRLITEERYLPAEDVLLPALRIAPNNMDLLQTAGRLYLAMEDRGRVQQVIDTLNRLETEQATRLASQLEAELLNRTAGTEEALAYLEQLAANAQGDMSAQALLLQARLTAGDNEGAIAVADAMLAEAPQNPNLRVMYANTLAATGALEEALEVFVALKSEFPNEPSLSIDISRLQSRLGRSEEARATIDEALANDPSEARLLWAKASYLESDGDIEGAIAIYEDLYQRDSDSIIVANNLASLLGTYRTDDESLEQAWTIARRFSDSALPAVQDTYGWIAHRRGDSEDALPHLESAANALSDDAIVQFHYAEALYATGQVQEALDRYRVVTALAGLGDTRDQIQKAQSQIAALEAELAGGEDATTDN